MGEFKTVDLGAIRARWEATTRGDWVLDRPPTDGAGLRFRVHVVESGGRTSVLIGAGPAKDGLRRDDAVFVAEAHRDVPELLALVERQTEALLDVEWQRVWSRAAKSEGPWCVGCGILRGHPEGHSASCPLDEALTAAGYPDELSRDMKRAALAGAR